MQLDSAQVNNVTAAISYGHVDDMSVERIYDPPT